MGVKVAVVKGLLTFIGIALTMPSVVIVALSPADTELMLISGLYISSGMMAFASIPLLAKGLKIGGILGITSCLLGFSSTILFSIFMALGLIAFFFAPIVALLGVIAVFMALLQLIAATLLMDVFAQLK